MKNKATNKWVTACSAVALALIAPGIALAGGHGQGGGGSSRASMGMRGGMDNVAGHNLNDNRGAVRGNRADDRAGHDANDDRGVRRNGADDRAGHDANDDNDNNRRRRGPGGR